MGRKTFMLFELGHDLVERKKGELARVRTLRESTNEQADVENKREERGKREPVNRNSL